MDTLTILRITIIFLGSGVALRCARDWLKAKRKGEPAAAEDAMFAMLMLALVISNVRELIA